MITVRPKLAVNPVTRLFLLLMVCAHNPESIVYGATIDVPLDHPTIQGAINAAGSGDTIDVAPDTYFESIDFLGKGITLRSTAGPAVTIIDGLGANGSVVKCVSGEGPDTVLQGFTITGGNANTGGGMLNINSSPTVIDCIFIDNHAGDRGGGMYNRQGSPNIIGSTFDGNSAAEMGGGMFNIRASPTVSECLFTQNSSNKGAGMRNYLNSHPAVINTTFSYNHAGEEGGGMDNRKNSNPVVSGCIFKGNTAGSGGGGMHNYVGRAKATGNPLIINCLFIGNSAPSGGGMRNNDPHPTIINTTITANIGSGISSRNGSTPVIENSVVWGNSDGSFSGASSGLSIVNYSDIEGGFAGIGNLNVNPLFFNAAGPDGNLATLDDNDYHLSAGSSLINAGTNTAPSLPATDLDGNPRIIGGVVDMGAYEFDAACSVEDKTDSDGDGISTCDGDCNDNDDSVHPNAVEICDAIDNDCSGIIDEGFDLDNDGFTTCGGDCNDLETDINPAAAEICSDELDNDCDGDIDGDDAECTGEPLLPKGASCTQNSECASNKCKGKSGSKTCK